MQGTSLRDSEGFPWLTALSCGQRARTENTCPHAQHPPRVPDVCFVVPFKSLHTSIKVYDARVALSRHNHGSWLEAVFCAFWLAFRWTATQGLASLLGIWCTKMTLKMFAQPTLS